MLSSASDKEKLFAGNFSMNSNLDDSSISLPSFHSRTNLKLRNIHVTPKLVKNVVTNLDSSKTSGPNCLSVGSEEPVDLNFHTHSQNSSLCVLRYLFFQIVGRSHLSRGNSRPKLRLAFRGYPRRFIFLKNLFYQKQCQYAMNIGVAQIRGTLL